MRILVSLCILLFCNFAHAVSYDDIARIDFPARNESVILAGCFSIYHPFSYVGLNCTEGYANIPAPDPVIPTRYESVTSTAFADRVYLVDAPCILVDMRIFPEYTSYALVCYDDVIFTNGFEENP